MITCPVCGGKYPRGMSCAATSATRTDYESLIHLYTGYGLRFEQSERDVRFHDGTEGRVLMVSLPMASNQPEVRSATAAKALFIEVCFDPKTGKFMEIGVWG